jgi:hypothetical protein
MNGVRADADCAGCGRKNPEYVLEDRQLCLECYKADLNYLC